MAGFAGESDAKRMKLDDSETVVVNALNTLFASQENVFFSGSFDGKFTKRKPLFILEERDPSKPFYDWKGHAELEYMCWGGEQGIDTLSKFINADGIKRSKDFPNEDGNETFNEQFQWFDSMCWFGDECNYDKIDFRSFDRIIKVSGIISLDVYSNFFKSKKRYGCLITRTIDISHLNNYCWLYEHGFQENGMASMKNFHSKYIELDECVKDELGDPLYDSRSVYCFMVKHDKPYSLDNVIWAQNECGKWYDASKDMVGDSDEKPLKSPCCAHGGGGGSFGMCTLFTEEQFEMYMKSKRSAFMRKQRRKKDYSKMDESNDGASASATGGVSFEKEQQMEEKYNDFLNGELPWIDDSERTSPCGIHRESHVVCVKGSFIKSEYYRRNEIQSSIGIYHITGICVNTWGEKTYSVDYYTMRLGDFQKTFPEKLSIQQMNNLLFHYLHTKEAFDPDLVNGHELRFGGSMNNPQWNLESEGDCVDSNPWYIGDDDRKEMCDYLKYKKNAVNELVEIEGVKFIF